MSQPDLFSQAIELHKQNKFIESCEIYKYLISKDENNFHALHYLGLAYLQNGFNDEGVELINRAIKIAGYYPEATHNLKVFGHSDNAKVQQEINSINTKDPYPRFVSKNISSWRMIRMMAFANVFVKSINSSWLTIGDAYGHDANILKIFGATNITASNLDASFLSEGKKLGEVDDFLQVNAENINLKDSSFDYILCKEALHHMPRPYMAIYEMLRVSKEAVILIEPLDTVIDYIKPDSCKVERKFISDNKKNSYINEYISYNWPSEGGTSNKYEVFTDWYEDGAFNYVYTLSQREIKKICNGMGLPGFAVKNFNDIYDPALDTKEDEEPFISSLKEQIEIQDYFCSVSGKPENYIACILFKKYPPQHIVSELESIGFKVHQTPTIFMPFQFVTHGNRPQEPKE